MGLVEITMPALGEGIIEATVLKWLKNVGDSVQEEEPILEIATDKVDSEVPATASGIIKELKFKENDIAPIGSVIAVVDVAGESNILSGKNSDNPATDDRETNEPISAIPYRPSFVAETTSKENKNTGGENNGFYSPLVLSIAKKEGIGFEELSRIKGTGNEGRLSKNDLLKYLSEGKNISSEQLPDAKSSSAQTQTQQAFEKEISFNDFNANTEIVEMDRMRKLIAHHMKESQNTSATVTVFAEADVTNMVEWRDKVKLGFEKREQTKITFTPMFFECTARVIKRFPLINSSISGDKIILKKEINIGMATTLPSGNLIVPVIKKVDCLNIIGLAKAVNDIAHKARTNQLKPSDTQEGTFTITNVGSFGCISGTPIINQPQVAILAIGTIKKKPVVIETAHGDTIGIRSMLILSLSFDHRSIDGALGATFLSETVKEIEAWDVNRKY